MHRRARPLLAASIISLLSAACSSDGGGAPGAASSSSASSTAPAAAAIELRGDGLGVVELGATPEAAIAAVSAKLGDPTADSGWEPSSSVYGTCPGDQIRGVEWDHLVLLFTDGETAFGSGPHLFTWRITGAPPALGTAKGLGYQATVADAQELYPGDVEVTQPDDPFPGFLTVAVDGGAITAYLDDDAITNLEAGTPCGE